MPARREAKVNFRLPISVEKDGGEYHAWSPPLKGLHVSGATREEAVENAANAAVVYLQTLIDDGRPIPVGVEIEEEVAEPRSKPRARVQFKDVTVLVSG